MTKPNIIGDTMTAKERLEIPSRGLQGWLNKWKTKNKIRQKERELLDHLKAEKAIIEKI